MGAITAFDDGSHDFAGNHSALFLFRRRNDAMVS